MIGLPNTGSPENAGPGPERTGAGGAAPSGMHLVSKQS